MLRQIEILVVLFVLRGLYVDMQQLANTRTNRFRSNGKTIKWNSLLIFNALTNICNRNDTQYYSISHFSTNFDAEFFSTSKPTKHTTRHPTIIGIIFVFSIYKRNDITWCVKFKQSTACAECTQWQKHVVHRLNKGSRNVNDNICGTFMQYIERLAIA